MQEHSILIVLRAAQGTRAWLISAEDLVAGYSDTADQQQLQSERCLYKAVSF